MKYSVEAHDAQKNLKNSIKIWNRQTRISIKKGTIVANMIDNLKEFILTHPLALQWSIRMYGTTELVVETNHVAYEDVVTTIGAFLHQEYDLDWTLDVSSDHLRLRDTIVVNYRNADSYWPPKIEVNILIYEKEATTCPITITKTKTQSHTYTDHVYALRCEGE